METNNLKHKIEKQRKKLNQLVANNNSSSKEILKESQKMDELLNQYYNKIIENREII